MAEYSEYRSSRTVQAYRVEDEAGESIATSTGPVIAQPGQYVVREAVLGADGQDTGQATVSVLSAQDFQAGFEVPDSERDTQAEDQDDTADAPSDVPSGDDSGADSEEGTNPSDNADAKSGSDDDNNPDDSAAARVRRASSRKS